MHAPIDGDMLLHRADAVLAATRQLRDQLSDQIAAARNQCRRARQRQAFQSGLDPAIAISLLVRQSFGDEAI
jgi:hypothetical protein